ncbi:hypothetical protein AALP_AA8G096000 [Arabis alpina]|uniref:Uncharacterized protein n=1 Tax=Arabis alpina TaxID=50452 RepID=A0A087G607_ARAAL|nr:hypothetical protein AALP_AA8G096000 [Arabis alpina]
MLCSLDRGCLFPASLDWYEHELVLFIFVFIFVLCPALRVKPTHPIVGAIAPIFSLVTPRFQFKGANQRGIPVTRDWTRKRLLACGKISNETS